MRKAYSYIRMSTETQLRGDSLRRQLEASASYAKANGLELVESLDGRLLRDIGVSGYKGVNSQKGVLGLFLEALENGRIERDAVLLVESLDRLSRNTMSDALTQFISILTKGIEIVTLADNQRYTKELIDNNNGPLFISLAIMFRANEESEMKSKRLQAAWQNKRNKAEEQPLTSICPGWMTYSSREKTFKLIPERVEVVKKIFSMCANTTGLYGIARYLNENNVPTFGRSKMWHRSYIAKTINNRSVLGEYQPHKRIDGKQTPYGDPIKNYYPAVISEQEFHLALAAVERRSMNDRGRKGDTFSNVFSGLLYCGNCGAKMMFRNRGTPPKGGKYLTCSRQNLRAGCDMPEWRYDDFTDTLFKHLRDVDFSSLNADSLAKEKSLSDRVDILDQQLATKEREFDRQLDLHGNSDLNDEAKKRLALRLNTLSTEIEALKMERALTSRRRDEQIEAMSVMNSSALSDLVAQLKEKGEDYLFRSSVNQALRKAIEKIDLCAEPFVFMPSEYEDSDEEVTSYRATFAKRKNLQLDEIVQRKSFMDHCAQRAKRMVVLYRNGAVRHVQFGSGISFKFKRTFDSAPLPSMRAAAKAIS